MKDNIAFSEGTPSLFIVTSPLQAICAIEAIYHFKIKDYQMILQLAEDIRNNQLFSLLKEYNINFSIVNIGFWKSSLLSLLPRRNGYERVFIGNYRAIAHYMYAFLFCKDGASIVLLDDGDDNIFLLKGYNDSNYAHWKERCKLLYYRKIVPSLRRIKVGKYLFTIYADITNPKFNCVINKFSFFSKNKSHDFVNKGVFFIGTNYDIFCRSDNYPEEMVKNGLEKCFKQLKQDYVGEKVFYIPHGRDKTLFPRELCDLYEIEYVRPDKTVELMFLDLGIIPKVVCGFTSTALYNIKLLFPSTQIYNYTFDVKHNSIMVEQTKVISEYYREHNIQEISL